MRLEAVDQFVPTFRRHDAIGNHSVATAAALAADGLRVANWAAEFDAGLAARDYREFNAADQGARVFLYQASTSAPEMADLLARRSEPLTLCYHNVTPAEEFAMYEPWIAKALRQARDEIERLCGRVAVALADSEFNAAELRAWGVGEVHVCPPFLPPLPPGPAEAARTDEREHPEILFVGRVVPNKGHVELLKAFAALRAGRWPHARLTVVGAPGPGLYMTEIHRLMDRLRLSSDAVNFAGSVSDPRLAEHYRRADVYLSMSHHEGFGVPLVEAMGHSLPVVALDSGAVGETLGGAGVLLTSADPLLAAEAVSRALADGDLRTALVSRGRERFHELDRYPRAETILTVVRRALEAAS